MLTVLRNRTYAHLFAAQVVSLLGTGLLTVALGLLAVDLGFGVIPPYPDCLPVTNLCEPQC